MTDYDDLNACIVMTDYDDLDNDYNDLVDHYNDYNDQFGNVEKSTLPNFMTIYVVMIIKIIILTKTFHLKRPLSDLQPTRTLRARF